MGLELEGYLIVKGQTNQVTESFKKQTFVVETHEKYPQKIAFDLVQEKCGAIDQYRIGAKVKVHFNVRGREWNGKYFVNLQAWRIEEGSKELEGEVSPTQVFTEFEPKTVVIPKTVEDDLPF